MNYSRATIWIHSFIFALWFPSSSSLSFSSSSSSPTCTWFPFNSVMDALCCQYAHMLRSIWYSIDWTAATTAAHGMTSMDLWLNNHGGLGDELFTVYAAFWLSFNVGQCDQGTRFNAHIAVLYLLAIRPSSSLAFLLFDYTLRPVYTDIYSMAIRPAVESFNSFFSVF